MSDSLYSYRNVRVPQSQFYRLIRTQFESLDELKERDLNLAEEDYEALSKGWAYIGPYTYQEAMAQEEPAMRRACFLAIGPEKFFPKIVTNEYKVYETVETVNRVTFLADGTPVPVTRDQKYVLWEIPEKLLGEINTSGEEPPADQCVQVLQVWCPSTDKEYWIVVGRSWTRRLPSRQDGNRKALLNALHRMFDYSSEPIVRQGDIFFTPHVPYSPRSYGYGYEHDTFPNLVTET